MIRPATERQLRREAAVHQADGRSEAIRGGIVGQVCGTLTSSIGILKGVSAPSRRPLIEVSLPPTVAVGGCSLGPPRVDGEAGGGGGGGGEGRGRGRGPRDDRHPGGDPDLIQRTMIKHRRCVLSCQVYSRSSAVSSCVMGNKSERWKKLLKVYEDVAFLVFSCVQPSPVFTCR